MILRVQKSKPGQKVLAFFAKTELDYLVKFIKNLNYFLSPLIFLQIGYIVIYIACTGHPITGKEGEMS